MRDLTLDSGRSIRVALSDEELAERRKAMEAKGKEAWKPAEKRERAVSQALRAYAAMTTSAARGAVRDVSQLEK
jgi:dihydroxy-acid dehydratase